MLFALDNALGRSRWGLSVPKKVGNAAARNRVKRRLREILRRTPEPERPRDLCLIARTGSPEATLDDLKRDLAALSERLSSSRSSTRTSA